MLIPANADSTQIQRSFVSDIFSTFFPFITNMWTMQCCMAVIRSQITKATPTYLPYVAFQLMAEELELANKRPHESLNLWSQHGKWPFDLTKLKDKLDAVWSRHTRL